MAVAERDFIHNIHIKLIDHEEAMLLTYPHLRMTIVAMLVDVKIEVIKRLKKLQQRVTVNSNDNDELVALRELVGHFNAADASVRKDYPTGSGGFVGHPMVAVSIGICDIRQLLLTRLTELDAKVKAQEATE
jgi:hypothetical protein